MATAPTGRPRGFASQKTTAAKQRIGNPGKRALPAPVLHITPRSTVIPEPPRPLATPGRTIWDRVLRVATWIDHDVDIEGLLMLCEQSDERASLRYRVLADGARLDRVALRALDAQIIAGMAALGMSPVDRARAGIGDIVPHVDPLDELRQQQTRGA